MQVVWEARVGQILAGMQGRLLPPPGTGRQHAGPFPFRGGVWCCHCQHKRPMANGSDIMMKIEQAYQTGLGQTCARILVIIVR